MHELQSLLLQKLPRLGELTPGCRVNLGGFTEKTIIFVDDYGFQTMGPGVIGGIEIGRTQKHLIQSVIGYPFTHADILEALGEDWAMTGDYKLLYFPRGHTSMVFGMDMGPQWIEKGITLPSNISDLSLPEYEETRKQLIQLLTK